MTRVLDPEGAHLALCADWATSGVGGCWSSAAATGTSRPALPETLRACSPSTRTPRQSSGHGIRFRQYDNGADLVDDFANKKRQLPSHAVPRLLALVRPCAVRERCRLRRLQVC